MYSVVMIAMNVKTYFKKKSMSEYTLSVKNTESKLAMLKILLNDNILTQEEFEQKKVKLLEI